MSYSAFLNSRSVSFYFFLSGFLVSYERSSMDKKMVIAFYTWLVYHHRRLVYRHRHTAILLFDYVINLTHDYIRDWQIIKPNVDIMHSNKKRRGHLFVKKPGFRRIITIGNFNIRHFKILEAKHKQIFRIALNRKKKAILAANKAPDDSPPRSDPICRQREPPSQLCAEEHSRSFWRRGPPNKTALRGRTHRKKTPLPSRTDPGRTATWIANPAYRKAQTGCLGNGCSSHWKGAERCAPQASRHWLPMLHYYQLKL